MRVNRRYNFRNRQIEKIGTAIFSNSSESIWRFPTCLIKEVDVDQAGYICFSVLNKYADMKSFERHFPSHLRFFNKKMNYCVEVDGHSNTSLSKNEVKIRFSVDALQYFKLKGKTSHTFLTEVVRKMRGLFYLNNVGPKAIVTPLNIING
jgi:hypothetical protein